MLLHECPPIYLDDLVVQGISKEPEWGGKVPLETGDRATTKKKRKEEEMSIDISCSASCAKRPFRMLPHQKNFNQIGLGQQCTSLLGKSNEVWHAWEAGGNGHKRSGWCGRAILSPPCPKPPATYS